MKDYLNFGEKEQKVTYIKNFKVNKDKIKIVFANGDKNVVPNTEKNKYKLEQQMEKQVEIGKNNYVDNYVYLLVFASVFIVLFLISGVLIQTIINNNSILNFQNLILPLCFGSGSVISGVRTKQLVDLLIDVKKSQTFVENKNLLKEITDKNKDYLLDRISSKAIKTFKADGPSINDVEKKFKLKDLKMILNNKKREEELNLNYEKVLKKSIKNDNKFKI